MKKLYKNYERSQEKIKNAVIELLAKKSDMGEITVSETVKLAGITRGTFYNHYSNVYEVLEDVKNDLITLLTNELRREFEKNDIDKFFSKITDYFTENEQIYKKLVTKISNSVISGLKEKFISFISSLIPNADKHMLAFATHGLTGLYLDYLTGINNLTLKQLEQYGARITKEFIGIIDNTTKK